MLRGFIGSVGYLADDIPNVRIPMGILSKITGDAVPFRWGYTEQRAFDEVKSLTQSAQGHSRTPISYEKGAPPVWLITDGSSTGISGVVSQGLDWKSAKVAAFYSAKLNDTQWNYPMHEIEMLAGICQGKDPRILSQLYASQPTHSILLTRTQSLDPFRTTLRYCLCLRHSN